MTKSPQIFLVLFLCLFYQFTFSQKELVDSLTKIYRNAPNDTTRASMLISISDAFSNTNIDTMVPLCNKVLELAAKNIDKANPAEKRSYLDSRAYALNNLGYVADRNGDITLSFDYHQRCLKIMEEIGNKEGMSMSLNNIGSLYKNQGDITRALEYMGKSLDLQREIGYKYGIALSEVNIAMLYNDLGESEKAIDYLEKSLKTQQELSDKFLMATSLGNMSSVLIRIAITSTVSSVKQLYALKALDYESRSLKIREQIDDKRGVAMSLNNIGTIYSHNHEPETALRYYTKSMDILKKINDKHGLCSSFTNVGKFYLRLAQVKEFSAFRTKNLQTAEKYCLQGMQMANELGYPADIRNAAEPLYYIYKFQNKGMESLKYHELYTRMKDSINNSETQKNSMKLNLQYEFAKKEADLRAEQIKKDVIAEQEKQKEKVIRYAVSGVLVLVLIFSFFLYNRFRIIQTQKKVIEDQKKLVENKQHEILDSIHYAKRIQNSLLPTEKYIERAVKKLGRDAESPL